MIAGQTFDIGIRTVAELTGLTQTEAALAKNVKKGNDFIDTLTRGDRALEGFGQRLLSLDTTQLDNLRASLEGVIAAQEKAGKVSIGDHRQLEQVHEQIKRGAGKAAEGEGFESLKDKAKEALSEISPTLSKIGGALGEITTGAAGAALVGVGALAGMVEVGKESIEVFSRAQTAVLGPSSAKVNTPIARTASGSFTLVAGTATVAVPTVTTNSVIVPTLKASGGTRAGLPDCVPTAGTGFTATAVGTDTSTYNYVIFESQ